MQTNHVLRGFDRYLPFSVSPLALVEWSAPAHNLEVCLCKLLEQDSPIRG